MLQDILEHDDYLPTLENVCKNEPLIQKVSEYCKQRNCETFIVSLSGGVDSMVISSIIKYLGYKLVCIHINYNNREASVSEAEFLEKWCKKIIVSWK